LRRPKLLEVVAPQEEGGGGERRRRRRRRRSTSLSVRRNYLSLYLSSIADVLC
jgi:hypothetical protein